MNLIIDDDDDIDDFGGVKGFLDNNNVTFLLLSIIKTKEGRGQ